MKTVLSWSSGKDSAWALHVLRQDPSVEMVALFTTFNRHADRVAMHAVRRSLAQVQAQAVGLALWEIDIPQAANNAEYEKAMQGLFDRCRREGVEAMAFGDLFLEDVRQYRLKLMKGTGLKPLFPLWGLPTHQLAEKMRQAGLKAWVTCVDPKQMDSRFVGKAWQQDLLEALPPGVDPCGEKGEFHTFTWDGPMFRNAVDCRLGAVVEKDGFVFADVLEADENS